MWRSQALRHPPEKHPWLRERSPACSRFIAAVGNTSIWAHAMEHHTLLVDALRLFCFKRRARRLVNPLDNEPAPPTMIDRAPYAWGTLRSVPDVYLKASSSLDDFFRPLHQPRLLHLSRGRHTRYPIAFAPPDICKLVLAHRSRIGRRFVLLGPWTPAPSFGSRANFGALPRGYDHGCRAEASKEGASACMLKAHFEEHCPNATLEHVREFLDDPKLIAWCGAPGFAPARRTRSRPRFIPGTSITMRSCSVTRPLAHLSRTRSWYRCHWAHKCSWTRRGRTLRSHASNGEQLDRG